MGTIHSLIFDIRCVMSVIAEMGCIVNNSKLESTSDDQYSLDVRALNGK